MSTMVPTPGSGSPAGSSPTIAAVTLQPAKPQRVLACVLCQRRKVKCDRQFPCANCIRSRVQCVPAALPRRRKRRFAERELLDHLHKCEDLLRRNNIKFDPLHPEGPANAAHATAAKPDLVSDSEDEQPHVDAETASSPSTSTQSGRTHETRNIWHAIRRAYKFLDDDESDSGDPSQAVAGIKNAWNLAYENGDHLLFTSNKPPVDLSAFHPDPVQIFRLWQIYLDNVNPLLKVTHSPTLQARIIEAAGNLNGINPNLEALMFAIYAMAVLSLVPGECEAKTGDSRDVLLIKYQFACKQALLNADFLRTGERDCLTALFLYLISARPKTDPRSMSSMLGMAMRIAQRMGIHTEVSYDNHSPFEAEMCRRLWWALMLFDCRMCEFVDYKTSMLAPTWDCRIPLNVDDADLRPEMKEQPVVKGNPTEAHFAVGRSALGDFIRHTAFHLDFLNPALKAIVQQGPTKPNSRDLELVELEKLVEEKYVKPCNTDNPMHIMTIWTLRGFLAKYRLIEHYWKFFDSPKPPTEEDRQILNKLALQMIDCDTSMLTSPLTKGFHWFTHCYFPFPAHIHLIQDIRRRPLAPDAFRAWECICNNYTARPEIPGGTEGPVFGMFSEMILRAWRVCEAAHNEQGLPFTLPEVVADIKQRIAEKNPNPTVESLDQTMESVTIGDDLQGGIPPGYITMNRFMLQEHYPGLMPMVYSPMFPQLSPGFGMNQMAWTGMDWNTMDSST